MSTAGPALPVKQHRTDDTMPSSWMARLEAARKAGVLSTLPEAEADDVVEHAPGNGNGNGNGHGTKRTSGFFETKPAHLLVAELEEEEREAKRVKTAPVAAPMDEAETAVDSITNVHIARPQAKAQAKHLPTWVWALGISVVVVVLGVAGWRIAFEEPPPEPGRALDPTLVKEFERRKEAMALLEEGHRLAMAGKDQAKAALAAYEKALDLEPNLPSALRGLASVYAAQDDAARAVDHYKMYLKLAPDSADAAQVREIVEKYESRAKKPKTRKRR